MPSRRATPDARVQIPPKPSGFEKDVVAVGVGQLRLDGPMDVAVDAVGPDAVDSVGFQDGETCGFTRAKRSVTPSAYVSS